MPDVRVSIDGLPELERLLKATGHRLTEAVKDAVAETALVTEGRAKRAAPVGTPESTGIKGYTGGRLRSSIGIDFDTNRLGAEVATVVEYAPYVEFGTSKMAAQPYMTPAREAAVSEFPDTVAKHARRVTGG